MSIKNLGKNLLKLTTYQFINKYNYNTFYTRYSSIYKYVGGYD